MKSTFKRVVTLDEEAFAQITEYAKQHNVTLSKATSCFVRAGISCQDFSERVEELLETVEPEPFVA